MAVQKLSFAEKTIRFILEELERYRLVQVPGNPSGTVWYVDKKLVPADAPKK
jgi:hypothetical protein